MTKKLIIFLSLVLAAMVLLYGIPSIYLQEGNRLFEAGEYEKAVETYHNVSGFLEQEGIDKAYEASCRMAEEAVLAKDFETAIAVYSQLMDTDKERETRQLYAGHMADTGDYAKALELYQQLDDEEAALQMLLNHMQQLTAEGREDEVPALVGKYTGADIAQRVFEAAVSKVAKSAEADAHQILRDYGSVMTDTDTQLAYCEMLRGEGYLMTDVYPDGVTVNADLGKYQFLKMAVTEESDVDFSKILIFSREENAPPALKGKTFARSLEEVQQWYAETIEKRAADAGLYDVRLLPGEMDLYGEEQRAQSLAECTAVILLEEGYYPDNLLTVESQKTSSMPGGYLYSTYEGFLSYCAYESIAVYNANNPLSGVVADSSIHYSLMSDCVLTNPPEDSDESPTIYIPEKDENGVEIGQTFSSDATYLWHTEKYMIGVHDEQWMEQTLENGAMTEIWLYIILQ